MSKTRMAQSREILAKIFMNRDEIKRDENGQNMFVRRCLLESYLMAVQIFLCNMDHTERNYKTFTL